MSRTLVSGVVLSVLAMGGAVQRAAAQWDFGPAVSVADTRRVAIGIGGTVNFYPLWPNVVLALRGYGDAEYERREFKPGLRYLEPDRVLIVDAQGIPQDPRTELWDGAGWDVHFSGYATGRIWRISAGAGFAYNGHNGSSGLAAVVIGHLTSIAELDVEYLGGNAWRARLSVGFLP